jgi:hypothetical protein
MIGFGIARLKADAVLLVVSMGSTFVCSLRHKGAGIHYDHECAGWLGVDWHTDTGGGVHGLFRLCSICLALFLRSGQPSLRLGLGLCCSGVVVVTVDEGSVVGVMVFSTTPPISMELSSL